MGKIDKKFTELCCHGSAEDIAKAIRAGADVNSLTDSHSPMLIGAAMFNTPDAVSVLLEHGADINGRSSDGKTALMEAMINDIEVITRLLDYSPDIDARDDEGKTALAWAVIMDNLEAVNILLEHGADVNSTDNGGATALLLASVGPNPKIMKALLQAGASSRVIDDEGLGTMHYAAGSFNAGLEELNRILSGDPFIRTRRLARKDTPIVIDVERIIGRLEDEPDTVEALRKAADHSGNKNFVEELCEILGRKSMEAVNLLIDAGFDDNIDEQGWTIMFHAAQYGTPQVVDRLLDTGLCILDARDEDGYTAARIASERMIFSGTNALKRLKQFCN